MQSWSGLARWGAPRSISSPKRNVRAVGIERFEPGHERGSSHGLTRIIRHGLFRAPLLCAPGAARLCAVARARSRLRPQAPDRDRHRGNRHCPTACWWRARWHHRASTTCRMRCSTAHDLMRRYPEFRLPQDYVGVIQPDGGFLEAGRRHPRASSARQGAAGAEIRTGERVSRSSTTGDGVRVTTERGTIEAGRAILAAGAWTTLLLPERPLPLQVTRQVLLWVRAETAGVVRAGQVSGLHDRKRTRHPLRLSAA